jgi:hypothetical protein
MTVLDITAGSQRRSVLRGGRVAGEGPAHLHTGVRAVDLRRAHVDMVMALTLSGVAWWGRHGIEQARAWCISKWTPCLPRVVTWG